LRIAVGRHDDIGMADGIVTRLHPAGTVTIIADGPLAAKADEINFRVPLAISPADRAFGIKGAVARLERDDVEGMRTVGAVALDDVAGVGDRSSPWRCSTIGRHDGC
jgi:hypothetical protein